LSNLTINVAGKGGCQFGEFWAASQAAPMRRVHVNGFATLMDYCSGPSYASGGFIADSQFSGSTVVNGSQQQYLVRNSSLDGWTNAVWNQVFAGVEGAPAQSFPDPPYTTLDTNPVSREKPFLYVDASNRFNVYVPDVQFDSSGTTWENGQTPGRSIPIERFFIARPTDRIQSINDALSRGKNVIFTPGVYDVDRTIRVKRPNTIVLGLGMATLTAQGGVVPMTVADVKGVEIAGLIFDAGPVTSPALLQFGDPRGGNDRRARHLNDPGALHDVFFRIGGPGAPTTAAASGGRPTPPTPASSSPGTTSSRRASSQSTTSATTSSGRASTAGRSCSRTRCRTTRPPRRRGSTTASSGGLPTRSPTRSRPTRDGASGATASSTSIPRSTRAAPSRCP
jgi:hypothetical protein